jgi:hypothetical protein
MAEEFDREREILDRHWEEEAPLRALCDAFLEIWPDAEFGPGHVVVSDDNFDPWNVDYCIEQTALAMTCPVFLAGRDWWREEWLGPTLHILLVIKQAVEALGIEYEKDE